MSDSPARLGVVLARRRLPSALAFMGLLAASPAFAQSGGAIAVPPPPVIVATPSVITPAAPPPVDPPQGLVQPLPDLTGSADLGAQSATQSPDTQPGNADDGAGPAAAVPPPAPAWLPGVTAELGVLNVVEGSVSQVTVPVGGQTTIGDLQVGVLACLRRPPGAIPDAAAFVTTAAAPNEPAQPAAAPPADAAQNQAAPDGVAPSYRGWILRSAPGAAVVGDAAETFRIVDCQ